MGNKGSWEPLYFRILDAHAVQDAKVIDGFLYIYQGSTCQLIIHRGLQIKGMSGRNSFMQQAHDNTGHGGLHETYQNLTDNYHWKDSFSDVKKFMESCEICQATKSFTQKPVGLLTPLTVPKKPWIEIGMDFVLLKQLVADCTKLILPMRISDKQKPHLITSAKNFWRLAASVVVRGCVINGLADNCQYAAHIGRQLVGQAIYLYCYLL